MKSLNLTNCLNRWRTLPAQTMFFLMLSLAAATLPTASAYAADVVAQTPSIDAVGAPCSVVPNVLEDNNLIRFFPERLAYPLPSAVTVTATDVTNSVLPQGTLVDSYYIHADWVNNGKNTPRTFDGSLTFAQPVYGVLKSSTALMNTHAILGAPGTTYSTTSADQGGESYGDNVWFSDSQTLNLHFSVYNAADQVRVLMPTSPAIQPSGAVEVVGAPCSVVENTLESDSAIRLFPERLNYVLPADLTVDAQGAPGTVLPQGTKINVYYVHADRVGDAQGVVKKLSGGVTFDQPILAVITNGTALNNTHSTLGATQHPTIKTAYSASVDQGIDPGDGVTVSANRVDFAFDVWNVADQVRIITVAN